MLVAECDGEEMSCGRQCVGIEVGPFLLATKRHEKWRAEERRAHGIAFLFGMF